MNTPGRPHATHVAFPVHVGDRGRTATAADDAYLRGLIEQVLFTRPGERVNRPDFGSGVDALIFTPAADELDEAARALVHGALQDALGDLIRVDDVTVEAQESVLAVTVVYTPLRTAADQATAVVRLSPGGRR